MGAFASLLEFDSPQRLAAHEHNTIILSRMLLALFDLAQPDTPSKRKSTHACLVPFKHALLWVSPHMRPAHAFAAHLGKYAEIALRASSPEAVTSRIQDTRGNSAYSAELRRSTKTGVQRCFVGARDLHHIALHLWLLEKNVQIDEFRVILQSNPQFLCLVCGLVAPPCDLVSVYYEHLAALDFEADLEAELERVQLATKNGDGDGGNSGGDDDDESRRQACTDAVADRHREDWRRLQLLLAINAADLRLLAHNQLFSLGGASGGVGVGRGALGNMATAHALKPQPPRVAPIAAVDRRTSMVQTSGGGGGSDVPLTARRSSIIGVGGGGSAEAPITARRSSIVGGSRAPPSVKVSLNALLDVAAAHSQPGAAQQPSAPVSTLLATTKPVLPPPPLLASPTPPATAPRTGSVATPRSGRR